MDPYTIGRLALPVVIGIVAVAALMTMAMGIFTAVKTLASAQRFFQHLEETQRPAVTINIDACVRDPCTEDARIAFTGIRSSKPPMQEQN